MGFRGFFTKANNEEGSASSDVLSFLYCILGNSGLKTIGRFLKFCEHSVSQKSTV